MGWPTKRIYEGTSRQRQNAAQKKYKLSAKGRATQSRYYKSDAKRASSRRWRLKPDYRIKKAAHIAVYEAKKVGKIIKKRCELCGNKGTYAHHDDYQKPLDVRWLCAFHHRQAH